MENTLLSSQTEVGAAPEKKQKTIVHMVQISMLAVIVFMFAVTSLCTWWLLTERTLSETDESLARAIEDTESAVELEISDYLLALTAQIAQSDIGENLPCMINLSQDNLQDFNEDGVIDDADINAYLAAYCNTYFLEEINIINSDGIIVYSNIPEYIGFDMTSQASGNEQAYEFYTNTTKELSYVQDYQPISYSSETSMRYAGVVVEEDCMLTNAGGIVQVGYSADLMQDYRAYVIPSVASTRRIGEGGRIVIAEAKPDGDGYMVSGMSDFAMYLSLSDDDWETYGDLGLHFDPDKYTAGERFTGTIYGVDNYIMYQPIEGGYYVNAMIPTAEAMSNRNTSFIMMMIVELLAFGVLILLVYRLVMNLVVRNIQKVTGTLSQITAGNLDAKVQVYTSAEFSSLSTDVNTTVDVLKGYIADAEAKYEQELEMAREIQYSALPSVFPAYPARNDFDIFASMNTAREVGGDFYDFYLLFEDQLVILIADVSGKGIPAALFMMRAKTILKSLAETGMPIEKVMTEANNKLCENNDAGMFVTCWMGIVNLKTGQMSFANAGHNPPLLKRKDGRYEYLKTRASLVLAGMEGVRYRRNELQLEPGDEIFLYTDGVTEATNSQNELYGDDRLLEKINGILCSDARSLCEVIKKDVDDFAGEADQFDDITMLCLQYNGFNGKEIKE